MQIKTVGLQISSVFVFGMCGTNALSASNDVVVPEPSCSFQASAQASEGQRQPSRAERARYFSCLNEYAEKLLQDIPGGTNAFLQSVGVGSGSLVQSSIANNSIAINQLDEGCFPAKLGGRFDGWTGEKLAARIGRQMREAALFLAVFNRDTGGAVSGPYTVKRIEICSVNSVKSGLTFQGETLTIPLPETGVVSYRELLNRWNGGEAFHDQSLAARFARMLPTSSAGKQWALLNPISPERIAIAQAAKVAREALQSVANGFADIIEKRSASKSQSAIDELRRYIAGSALAKANFVSDASLQRLTEEEARSVLQSWVTKLRDPATVEGVLSSNVQLSQRELDIQFDRDVWALVGVSNWHNVETRVAIRPNQTVISIDSLKRIEAAKEPAASTKITHRYRFRGGISVDTVDNIQTDLQILIENSAERSKRTLKDTTLLLALGNELI